MKLVEGVDSSDDEKKAAAAGKEEAIEVDEIQLEMQVEEKVEVEIKKEEVQVNPENAQQEVESEEQKVKFIQQVFIKPLLSRVFKFIDEKQEMDSKRKTWNLKHKVEQVEDLKRQKQNWEYHSYQKSSLQARMQAIFQESDV